MSEERKDWQDADLVAWILDRQAREESPRDELEDDLEVRARLEGYEDFLERCRGELREGATDRQHDLSRLNDAILGRTTREDVSWGGDLRLVGGFLRNRLHASVVLRVVAASLLIHIAALPVLAYFGWVQPEPRTHIGFEFPGELPYGESEPEPDLPLEVPGEEGDGREAALDSLGAVDAGELLRERLRSQGRVDLDGFSGQPSVETETWGDALGLVLRSEQLLDEREQGSVAVEGEAGPRLGFVLGRLREELSRLSTTTDEPALRALGASAWLRASEAGLGAGDALLTARCRRWLGSPSALEGQAWRAAFELARRESDAR